MGHARGQALYFLFQQVARYSLEDEAYLLGFRAADGVAGEG